MCEGQTRELSSPMLLRPRCWHGEPRSRALIPSGGKVLGIFVTVVIWMGIELWRKNKQGRGLRGAVARLGSSQDQRPGGEGDCLQGCLVHQQVQRP